jgi:hypothetical protein
VQQRQSNATLIAVSPIISLISGVAATAHGVAYCRRWHAGR